MNDLSNSLPPAGDDALEARIVAWVLGEASPFEAAELEKLCAENPHLRAFERRIRDLDELLAADAKPGLHASWQLPAEKRGKITDLLGSTEQTAMRVVPESGKIVRYFSRRSLLAAAACLAISLIAYSMFAPMGSSVKYAARSPEKSVDFMPSASASFEAEMPDADAAERRLDVLRRAVTQQQDLVEDKRKLLSSIVRQGKFVSDSEQAGAGLAFDDATDAARNYAKLEQEKIQLESQIETLTKYDGNQLRNYVGSLDLPDNVIPSLLPQYDEAKREYEAAKASGLGEQHPDLAEREKRLAGMERDLNEATVNLRESLKAKHELAKDQLARVEARMTGKKDEAVQSGLELQSYVDAKKDFESQQRQLEQLKLKLISEEMDAKAGVQSLAANEPVDELKTARRELAAGVGERPAGGGITEEVRYKFDAAEESGAAENAQGLALNGPQRQANALSGPVAVPPPAAEPTAPATPAPALATAEDQVLRGDLMALQDGEKIAEFGRAGGGGGGFGGGAASGLGGAAGGRGFQDAPAKPGQASAPAGFAGGKELTESNKPAGVPMAPAEAPPAPVSGPAVASAATALSDSQRGSELTGKDTEIARAKQQEAAFQTQTAATDRYAGDAVETKRKTAAPAEPESLNAELELKDLAANGTDKRSRSPQQQEQVEQKGEKLAWHVQDEATKAGIAGATGLRTDAPTGGPKADLSKNLADKDQDAAVANGLATITPDAAAAAHSFFDASGDVGAFGNRQAEGAGLASGSGPTADGSTSLRGRTLQMNGSVTQQDFDGFVNYGTSIDVNGALTPLNPQVRPPGGMPTERDIGQGTPDLNAYYFSQVGQGPLGGAQEPQFRNNLFLGTERGDSSGGPSLSFALDALPGLSEDGTIAKRDLDSHHFGIVPPEVTRSGRRSEVEIIREFQYPKEYQPPELPNSIAGGTLATPAPGIFPVTPATPSAFGVHAGGQPEGGGEAVGALAKDAKNVDAKRVNEWLEDPIRTNPALTYEKTENADKVRGSLSNAEGAYNLGKFDDAFRHYEDVIRTDPYNKAARRGMERVAQARSDYYRAAYDQTRAQLLAQVDKAWELSVPPVEGEKAERSESEVTAKKGSAPDQGRADLLAEVDRAWDAAVPPAADGKPGVDAATKARMISIPEFTTGEATVGEVLDELRRKAVASDTATGNPNLKGIALAIRKDGIDVEGLQVPPLELKNATVSDVLAKISETTGLDLESNAHFLTLKPGPKTKGKQAEQILDKMAEVVAATEPFSTFSLHVSDASFKMAKAALDRGEQPAAESIRPEEFYNAFDYGDPAPAHGEPVVCVTEQAAHPAVPQRNLLRIGVRTAAAGRGASTPLNLTLLLDSSGSMERVDRQAAMTRAVSQLSGLLKEGDTITIAGFARQPRLLADRLPGSRAKELNQIVAQTPSEGGTNLEEGLKLAEELAKRQFNPAAQNRIVLFTDGAANLGDARPEALRGRVEQLRQQGISFDAAGFGADGLNDRLLEQLTRNGNGRYYIVDRPEEAGEGFAKQLAGAFRPAAENVKVQVRFNPARVARYKLLGFEEHRLKKEDFRNDAVDAAEMAAEEAGNALYQIEALPNGEGQVGEVSVRFRDAASGQMVERTWTIPYEAQAAAFDRATPSIQLAGLAAFAAEKLRQAPLSDALDFKQLGKSFPAVSQKYPDSQAVRDLGGMIEKLK